jgi:hypothetical protein
LSDKPTRAPSEEAQKAANQVFICTMDRDTRENITWALDAFAAQHLSAAHLVIEAVREWEKSLAYKGDIHETFNVARDGIDGLKNALAEYDRTAAGVATEHRISMTIAPSAFLDPNEEVVEVAAQASYERYQFLCGPAFRPWGEIPLTSREIYIEAQRAALRAAALKITGR